MNQSYYATVHDNIESQDLLLYQYLLEVGLLLLHQNQIKALHTKKILLLCFPALKFPKKKCAHLELWVEVISE